MSRVHNVETWAKRIQKVCPISSCAVETVRFDMQKMESPEISGIEYQQGELLGYEVREYLLEKWGRKCVYCGKENVSFEVEHIQPRSRGGTNRVSNLTIACHECNQKKDNIDVRTFLKNKPELLQKILTKAKAPLKDAAAVNATRYAVGNAIKSLGLPTTFWSGGRTKKNRISQGYKKDHWIDAACVGTSGEKVSIPQLKTKTIKATGHGDRQLCLVDKHGFPRSKAATLRIVKGFKTGDSAVASVVSGKKIGIYKGKVAVRASGSFNISTNKGIIQGISYKYFRKLHGADGYSY
jgi:5-methylcytosine-specific restriction endonuclease McrA